MLKADAYSVPGDIVILRGAEPTALFADPNTPTIQYKIGTVLPTSFGVVVSSSGPWRCVLWSVPSLVGWLYDGHLRKLKL